MKRIKSIKNIILLGYLIIGFTSCDFLDRSDPDKLNKNDFYKTENDMYQALNASYDGLKTNYYNSSVIGDIVDKYLKGDFSKEKFIRQLSAATEIYLTE